MEGGWREGDREEGYYKGSDGVREGITKGWKLPKRSETMKHDGCRKRGRPQLRWEDCVKRDLRKAEEEEKWREKANNRDQWKRITKVAVHRSDK